MYCIPGNDATPAGHIQHPLAGHQRSPGHQLSLRWCELISPERLVHGGGQFPTVSLYPPLQPWLHF